jgi:alcohol dehydrogenase
MSSRGWRYHNPVRVVSAAGAASTLGEHIAYRRLALVTTPGFTRRGVVDRIRASLGERLVEVLDEVKPNPDVRDVDAQAARLRGLDLDAIIALGGGSSIDSAKGLARALPLPVDFSLTGHFREGLPLPAGRALPVVALPTTAGTGAEVTPFGTLWDFERAKKYSVVGDDLYPAVALLDSELTLGLPWDVTVSSGLDAVSHALESAWNRNASPISLALCGKSLQLSLSALPRLLEQPDDRDARGGMLQASLLAGMAISQTRTALAHSISYPLTARFGLPHGLACSFTLPVIARFNAAADDGRLHDLARATGFEDMQGLASGLSRPFRRLGVAAMFQEHIPDLSAPGMLLDEMFTPGRADNNLRDVGSSEIATLLAEAMDLVACNYEESGQRA